MLASDKHKHNQHVQTAHMTCDIEPQVLGERAGTEERERQRERRRDTERDRGKKRYTSRSMQDH